MSVRAFEGRRPISFRAGPAKLIERCGEAVAGADRVLQAGGRLSGHQDSRGWRRRQRTARGARIGLARDLCRGAAADARWARRSRRRVAVRRVRAASSASPASANICAQIARRHSDEPARDRAARAIWALPRRDRGAFWTPAGASSSRPAARREARGAARRTYAAQHPGAMTVRRYRARRDDRARSAISSAASPTTRSRRIAHRLASERRADPARGRSRSWPSSACSA